MRGMMKKYGVSVSFYRKLMIFAKIVGEHLWILSKNMIFLKPVKTNI
jgi:hypothetical protein